MSILNVNLNLKKPERPQTKKAVKTTYSGYLSSPEWDLCHWDYQVELHHSGVTWHPCCVAKWCDQFWVSAMDKPKALVIKYTMFDNSIMTQTIPLRT